MDNFLRLAEEHSPDAKRSMYKIVLIDSDKKVIDSIDLSGTSYVFDLFKDIKKVIELGEDIKVPEDQESALLSPEEREALQLGKELGTGAQKRFMGKDPMTNLNKVMGDVINTVADRIKGII